MQEKEREKKDDDENDFYLWLATAKRETCIHFTISVSKNDNISFNLTWCVFVDRFLYHARPYAPYQTSRAVKEKKNTSINKIVKA